MFVPILAYHNIGFQFEWGINVVSPRLFEKHIKYLATDGYQSIRIEQYISGDIQKQKPVIITFDDAYQQVFEYAYPVLDEYGFTASIFVVTDYVGKKNTWDINLGGKSAYHMGWGEIKELASKGWEIGSHTSTHPDLVALSDEALALELSQSRQELQARFGTQIHVMSYPFNRCNTRVVKAVQSAGYSGACCLAGKLLISSAYRHFTIPRRGVYAIDDIGWFKHKLKNHVIGKLDDFRQKIISTCAVGSVYYKRMKKLKKSIAN
ncbi:polysaccharide deacetylase family protein [candidate division KSB1 bacterium]|nr:polysaccharide deacetylase family protein [candidate division KSB1 bacterium]